MNNLTIFQYEEKEVRTVTIDGEPWWVLKDVCAVLELTSPHKVAERLDGDEKGRSLIPTLGGNQEATITNESGLYAVILRSDKPNAKAFRRWITSEVLPSIRKYGTYAPSGISELGYTNTQRLGEVVELAKLTVRLMKDRKSKPDDIAKTVGEQLEQFGIVLPTSFYPSATLIALGVASSSESVRRYLSKCNEIKNRAVREVYDDYLNYCTNEGIASVDNIHAFGREIINQTGLTSRAKRLNGKTVRTYV